MSISHELAKKVWLLPTSPDELDLLVGNAIGGILGSQELERSAVYSRVSSIDSHVRSYSMEFQPDRSEEYARSKNWLVTWLYANHGLLGQNSKHPDLQHLIRDIESGKITVMAVHCPDRRYGNMESLLHFLSFLKRYHHPVAQPIGET
jgi:hypothetical protein